MLAKELSDKNRDINNQINKLYHDRMLLQNECPHEWEIYKTFYNGFPEAEYDFSLGGKPSISYSRKCKICGCTS